MTLDDFERQNNGFYGFFGDFELRDTFQKQIGVISYGFRDMASLSLTFFLPPLLIPTFENVPLNLQPQIVCSESPYKGLIILAKSFLLRPNA